jgi:hypothetical protein
MNKYLQKYTETMGRMNKIKAIARSISIKLNQICFGLYE